MADTMTVTRVYTLVGDHVEPPLDPTWDDLTSLRWLAAVVSHDTGLQVRAEPAQRRGADGALEQHPGMYWVLCGGTSTSGMPRDDAWRYLTGISTGAEEAHRTQPPGALPTLAQLMRP